MMKKEELEKLAKSAISDFSEKIKDRNFKAKLIAAYVRNGMEDFHCKYLSDEQMKELNPLIRNAIYTALTDIENMSWRAFLYSTAYIPNYWEDCESWR